MSRLTLRIVHAGGGGYSARTLYTSAEESILELRKPIVLNGINVIVTAQDLLDRCLHIDLPTIQSRELAGDMEERFEAAQPALLGALLDLFVKVLAMLPSVSIAPEHRPRMADFAVLGEAVCRVYGEPAGALLTRYSAMRKDGVLRTIDASPVGAALTAYLSKVRGGFIGPLSELLERLDPCRPHGEAWPRSAKGLGDAAAAGTRTAADRVRVQEPTQNRRGHPVAHLSQTPAGRTMSCKSCKS